MPRHTPILTAEDALSPLTPIAVSRVVRRRQSPWMVGLGGLVALLGILLF